MLSTRPENSSLKIDQHDRFFSKLLSKEASAANSSSRILYYDGAVRAVPFVWEACPGTPKRLPPPSYSFDSAHAYNLKPFLTPPPYYLARQDSKFSDTSLEAKMRRGRKFLRVLLSMLGQKRSVVSPTCSVSSSKLSSSSSSWLHRPHSHGRINHFEKGTFTFHARGGSTMPLDWTTEMPCLEQNWFRNRGMCL